MVRQIISFSLKNIMEPNFRRFLIVGALGTSIDFCLFFIGYNLLGLGIVIANLISYGTGITCSFFFHRSWTFRERARKRSKRRLGWSLAFGYTGLLLNTLMVWAFALMFPVWIGKIAAVGVILFYNYLTNKYIVFAAH